MFGQIILWTLAIILIVVVGGGGIMGVILSYRDQHVTNARRRNVRS
jgi:hypothetical protein